MGDVTIYTLSQLEEIFPFGKSKLLALCKAGVLPVVKVGRDYISSPEMITRWMLEHDGKEVLY